jgi:peptidoglycan/xylan/chitin deacetylase (PgdA/CDA1 family)
MTKKVKLLVLRAARLAGLFWLCRYLTRNKIRIVCYHGGSIGDEHRFNPLLFSRAALLESRLKWLLGNNFTVLSLDGAVRLLDEGATTPRCPVVLTFDDGWYSTYDQLHPVVKKFRVPATLYLSTAYFVQSVPNIGVTINYIIWKAQRRPVVIVGFDRTVDRTCDLSSEVERDRLHKAMAEWVQSQSGHRTDVCRVLEQFAEQLGVSDSELNLQSRRFDFVGHAELTMLAAEGWSVQLHGHIHRFPAGQPDVLVEDLRRCAEEIRKVGLPTAVHYCYPSGSYDDDAGASLRTAGVSSATTCNPGLVGHLEGDGRYYLPRFLDGENVDRLEFEAEMSGFTDILRRIRSASGTRRHQQSRQPGGS